MSIPGIIAIVLLTIVTIIFALALLHAAPYGVEEEEWKRFEELKNRYRKDEKDDRTN